MLPLSGAKRPKQAATLLRSQYVCNASQRVWEHLFVTAQPHAHVRFRRAIERRALWMAEDAARELQNLSLEDALQLVRLYGECESPTRNAALRWLERYLTEGSPRLQRFAEITASLAERELGAVLPLPAGDVSVRGCTGATAMLGPL